MQVTNDFLQTIVGILQVKTYVSLIFCFFGKRFLDQLYKCDTKYK